MLPAQGIYATEFISGLNIDQPSVLDILYEKRGDQWQSFMRTIDMIGFAQPVDQEEYFHYEDDWTHRKLRMDPTGAGIATGTGAAGVVFTIDLDAADTFTSTLATKHVYARIGDLVAFPNLVTSDDKDVVGLVVDVDATATPPNIDVRLLDSAKTAGEYPAGTYFIIYSGAFAEGTGQPTGIVENIRRYSNVLQIIKESWQGTGTEMTNGKWFKRTNGGEKIPGFWWYGMNKVDYRMELKIDGALMFGEPTTNVIPDPLPEATGRPVVTTQGLVPWAKANGSFFEYSPGFFNMADFDTMATTAEGERAGNYLMFFHGFNFGLEVENTMIDWLKNTNVSYIVDDVFGGDEAKAIRVRFSTITKAQTTFMFKKLEILSHPQLWGAEGFEDRAGIGILCPYKNVTSYKDIRKRGMTDTPAFGYCWKQLGEHSRKLEVWEINGTGHRPALRKIIAQDIDNLYSRSHIGFRGMAGNSFQVWQPEVV